MMACRSCGSLHISQVPCQQAQTRSTRRELDSQWHSLERPLLEQADEGLDFDEPQLDPSRSLGHDDRVHEPVQAVEAGISCATPEGGGRGSESARGHQSIIHSLLCDHAKVWVQDRRRLQLLQFHLDSHHGMTSGVGTAPESASHGCEHGLSWGCLR